MDNINEIMERIEELLEDRNETVTYIMLSEEFNLTTVNAREIMEKYVQKRKERDPDSIGVLYVVYGITKAEGRNYVAVMTPTAMEEQKEKLTDCHTMLLSLYKKTSKDSSIQPDPFGIFRATKAPLFGCIVSRNAVKRKLKPRPTTAQTSAKIEVEAKKAVSKVELNTNNGNKKQNGLGNFLSKATSKPEIEKKPPPKPKSKNMMTNFFSKAPTKSTEDKKQQNSDGDKDKKKEIPPSSKIVEEIEDIEMKTVGNEELNNLKKHKLIDTDDSEDDVTPAKKANVTQSQNQKKNKRPRNEKKKNEQPSKKRRRIINDTGNSDSDDIFGSDNEGGKEDEDIVNVSDTEEVKVTSIVAPKNARKVRKKVSDMFLEEEGGYFQTVNKWEYESASDKEEEKEQKPDNVIQQKKVEEAVEKKSETSKPKSNVSPPKAMKNGKGKVQKAVPQTQTSIMSFFKKK